MDKIKTNLDKFNGLALMDFRKVLETIFNKKDIDFSLAPIAHFQIKTKQGKICICSKNNVDIGKNTIIINDKYACDYL